MGDPRFGKWLCAAVCAVAASLANAAQWAPASGTVSARGDEVILVGGPVTARAHLVDIPVVAGQTYTLTGQARSSGGGAWTYIGVVNGGVETERGNNASTYTPIAPITFTAKSNAISVYGSFWRGQQGSGYVKGVALNGQALVGPTAPPVATGPCAGTYVLCDDFDGNAIDTSVWTIGNLNIAQQYPVRPGNVSLTTYDDNGRRISVVDAKIHGDLHAAAPRQGGLLISKKLMGGGRYEVRMKTLPGPNGCSCFWNYYDSLNEANPPAVRIYTEIDIEMPAHMNPAPAWNSWRRTLGFNTWSHTDSDADATYINHPSPTVDPFDGNFHVFRWDWYDGINGSQRIDWYVDGILQATTTQHVGSHPAQLWVGNWPAPWPGMDYNFDTLHLYIDWVRVSALK